LDLKALASPHHVSSQHFPSNKIRDVIAGMRNALSLAHNGAAISLAMPSPLIALRIAQLREFASNKDKDALLQISNLVGTFSAELNLDATELQRHQDLLVDVNYNAVAWRIISQRYNALLNIIRDIESMPTP
jgi:hypothetical protein